MSKIWNVDFEIGLIELCWLGLGPFNQLLYIFIDARIQKDNKMIKKEETRVIHFHFAANLRRLTVFWVPDVADK